MSSTAGGSVTTAGERRGGDCPRPYALALSGEGLSAKLVLHYEILPFTGPALSKPCSPAADQTPLHHKKAKELPY